MTGLEFIASLIGSLAWPATAVTLAVIFRKPLGRVLLTLTALRFKDLELDFKREFSELEAAAKAVKLEAPEVEPKPIGPGQPVARRLEEEIEAVAAISPAAAIPLAWSAVEAELMSAVQLLAVSPDYPPYNSAVQNLRLLREYAALDEDTYVVLDRMRQLRNRAVHGRMPPDTVSSHEAAEFGRFAQNVIGRLRALKRE